MRARALIAAALLGLGAVSLWELGPVLAMRPYTPKIQPGQATVKLTVRATPRIKARVWWGKKLLGETPLDLKWPRDSGPLDIVVEAQGFLPLHTRLYTFNDDRLSVQLTPEAEKKNLFGYRREIPDGGLPAAPDGGAAPPAPPAAGAPPPVAPVQAAPASAAPPPPPVVK